MVEGISDTPSCRPIVCIADDPKPCAVYFSPEDDENFYFDPAKAANGDCCFAGNIEGYPDYRVCTKAELADGVSQCGEQCHPGVCRPNSPSCLSVDCIDCEQFQGDDVYRLESIMTAPVCFSATHKPATADLPARNVGIACSAHQVEFFGAVEENRDIGEIDCEVYRKGGDLSNNNGGLNSGGLPCVYAQLGFCGCGPPDMFNFDLPPPLVSCKQGKDLEPCPITFITGEVSEEPCNCPICDDIPGRQSSVCDSFHVIAERLVQAGILATGSDGFDLWEQWFLSPNGLGSGEPEVYEFDIYDL